MPELLATSLPEYIAAGLKEVAQEQGFTEGLYRLESESGSNMGDGFVGQLLKVFIREADRELVVLCKLLPESEMRKQQGIPLFDRETEAYMQILPLLTKFQDEKALAKHLPRFDNVPRCYYAKTTLDKMESVIIMEDLRLQAYRMWDKANPVDFEHARLLMVTLGRLHALSFAIKDQQPEEFAKCRAFEDPMGKMLELDPTKGFEVMMAGMCRRAIETLDQHDNFRREKLKQIQDRCVQEIVACTDGKAAEPYAIVGHGDCWSNNMMFQYAEDNKTPSNIKLIDWQLSRYGSPVLDLVYFIFNCTDEEMRSHSYQRLLSIYYHSLSEHLHNLGGDVERQYPRIAFREQLKKFGRYGLVMSMMVLPIICTPNDELPDTDTAMEGFMNDMTNGNTNAELAYGTTEKAAIRYRKRMSGCIRDTIRYKKMSANQNTAFPRCFSGALKEVAREQGFTEGLYRLESESGSKFGDGFAGDLVKVFIREGDRELVVLCKLLPENETRKQQGISLFVRETEAYMKILPLLTKFQDEKALAKHLPRFDNVPRCYYAKTTLDMMESVIIMEDLRLQAYRMWDKANPVDFEHARLLMATLGRLHALSFAMKDQQPEEFAKCRAFEDPMGKMLELDPTKGFEVMMAGMCRRAIETLDQHDNFRREKLKQIQDRCVQEIVACTDGKAAEPYAIVGHGDCWSNNMMFQYAEDNKTPSNIKLIDWQLSRYGSPVLDLVYFIFNCTDEEMRSHSYQRLLSIYYHSLSEHLHNLGGDVERQYPRIAFREQLKKFGRYGLVMSMMVLPIICTPNDELPDTDTAMEGFMNDMTNGNTNAELAYGTTEKAAIRYRKRMSGCIRDTIRYGYI
uniref:uncharacterized protein LOC125906714 n=1 Tax=Anopheles coluzzii TaxID=1518534 RepID=UPI0020FFEEB3|nr:uncharacterized protein LOC125906714 [Anopheles coluzzii]